MNGLCLRNGRVVDVAGGRVYAGDVGVAIRGGKIAALPGLPGEPDAAQDCRPVDLGGRYVIPGLFNTHCHLQLLSGLIGHTELRRRQMEKNMADCIEAGITNIRDAWAPDLALNRGVTGRADSGSLPGPRVQQCVVVCPEGNWCAPKRNMLTRLFLPLVDYGKPDSGAVAVPPDATGREVRDAVDRAVDERGADCIKLYDQDLRFLSYKPGGAVFTDAQTAAAADQARKRGVPATAHHTRARHFRRNVACGVSSLAHLPMDEPLADEDIAAFLGSGCTVEPTLSVSYGMAWGKLCETGQDRRDIDALEAYRAGSIDEMIGQFWLPELAAIYRKNYANYSAGNFKVMGLFDMSGPARMHTIQRQRGGNFRLLYEYCRDRIALGTDATVFFCTQAAIPIELALMKLFRERDGSRADPADLLRIATIQSARAMGLDDRFGSIEAGKTADLVILDGNPLERPELIGAKAAAVFKEGRLVSDRCGLLS